MPTNVLTIHGSQLVDGKGQIVTLRGFGLGGWMNMENFITGYPANEEAQRQAIQGVLGNDKYEFFFDRFLEYFFGPDDAQFIASLGLNLLKGMDEQDIDTLMQSFQFKHCVQRTELARIVSAFQ